MNNDKGGKVIAFRYPAGMPSASQAIATHVENMIATFGREYVQETLKAHFDFGAKPKAKRKLSKVG